MRLMKTIIALVVGLGSHFVHAAQDAKAKSDKKNISFEDLLVQGKYQTAREAVVTVEEDKVLNSLLQVRKDFKDRIKVSAGLEEEENEQK